MEIPQDPNQPQNRSGQSNHQHPAQQLGALDLEWAELKLPDLNLPLEEEAMFHVHTHYCSNAARRALGKVYQASSELEKQVMSKLENDFRSYVRSVAERLDAFLPEQQILIPSKLGGIYFPKLACPLIAPSGIPYHTPLQLVVAFPDGSKRYLLLSQVTNSFGVPLIYHDTYAFVHERDCKVGVLESQRGCIISRISRKFAPNTERQFLESGAITDYQLSILYSRTAFDRELKFVEEQGTEIFSSAHSRCYFAKIILHAIGQKLSLSQGDFDPNCIYEISASPNEPRRPLSIYTSAGNFKLSILLETPALKPEQPSWQLTYIIEDLS